MRFAIKKIQARDHWMKIMVISGSPRSQSNTYVIASNVRDILQKKGAEVLFFDVAQNLLPLYNGEESQRHHPEVARLFAYAEQAEAFFILSPEYHSGMSGALKNALDYLSRNQFDFKPVAIASAAGGGKGGINALNNLRIVIRGVGGLVLSEQCVVDPSDITDQGHLKETIHMRLNLIADQLVDVTRRLNK